MSQPTHPTRPLPSLRQRPAVTASVEPPTPGRPQSFTNDDAIAAAYRAGLAGFSVKGVRDYDGVPFEMDIPALSQYACHVEFKYR